MSLSDFMGTVRYFLMSVIHGAFSRISSDSFYYFLIPFLLCLPCSSLLLPLFCYVRNVPCSNRPLCCVSLPCDTFGLSHALHSEITSWFIHLDVCFRGGSTNSSTAGGGGRSGQEFFKGGLGSKSASIFRY